MKFFHRPMAVAWFVLGLVGCGGADDSVDRLPQAMRSPTNAVVEAALCTNAESGSTGYQLVDGQCLRSADVLRSPFGTTASPARAAPAAAVASASATTLDANALFDWAERSFPTLLPGHSSTQEAPPFVYRYYAATQTYLGVAEGKVYALGPITGGALAYLGTLESFGCAVLPANCAPSAGVFTLTSPAGAEGGSLPPEYTCDGAGSTIALSWSNAPVGTSEFALLMSTLPGDGTIKWNWVLYGIAASKAALIKDSVGVGTLGVGSDGPTVAYQPPCSQGPGAKVYTFTLYALSAAPVLSVPPSQVSGAVLTNTMAGISLGTTSLNLSYSRAAPTGSAANCVHVRNSMAASTTGTASVTCDDTYAYVSSNGLASHTMMDGITATNLQVPITQDFFGAKAWKIPLKPAIAPTTTAAVDGPIGVAINGVPIFNPCKQGGCGNGDTKVLGELDVCNGHAGRADDYHYHAAPICLMAGKPANYWDTHPLGWALDGFAIFGYNNADGSTATRDGVCGGNTSVVPNAPAGYSYHVTDASPYVLSCLRGTPSPDLVNQGAKFSPIRQPPVKPFGVSGMTLTTDAADGYQVLQFSSSQSFVTNETGTDSYLNAAGSYKIRYKPVTGAELASLLALSQNRGKSMCWNFQFTHSNGASTQPTVSYCR